MFWNNIITTERRSAMKIIIFLFLGLFCTRLLANDLIIVSADWCANCIQLKYFLSENESKYSKEYKIKFVDYDKDKEYKQKYNIKSIPTSLIIKDGKIKSMKVGYGDDYGTWLNVHKNQD
jgi:thiol-disulfide isomerase/thioredoxin